MSNIQKLRAPFSPDRIEWRLQSCGSKPDGTIWARCLAYIDNRAAMERLDEVYGEDWSHREDFRQIGNSAVCTVAITIAGEGEFQRTVCGSCEVELNKTDDIDPFKSAASGAMKRAVVNLGVGRYLYEMPDAWAEVTDSGIYQGKTKEGVRFKWNPPSLGATAPAPYEPAHVESKPSPARAAAPATSGNWRDVVIPFGKQQGKTLGSLPPKSLQWWQENYQPKPYKGAISAKDQAFRSALDQSMGDRPMALSAEEPETQDDVPF
jgi:hypothetical protein